MGKALRLLLGICIFFVQILCFGQSEFRIDNPKISLRGHQIYISYNILNSSVAETYSIRLEITDEGGNLVNAKSFSGDVGAGVRGGTNKTIIWNLAADNVFINEDLYFQLYAKATNIQNSSIVKNKSVNKASIILQSVAFPGWGLTRLKGGPHWLKGVAGYGCIAGSLVFNNLAYNTNLEYRNSSGSSVEATNLLDKAIQQDNISEILAYTAIGIWITDLVWTVVATSNANMASINQKGISIGTDFDTLSKAPMLALRYKF